MLLPLMLLCPQPACGDLVTFAFTGVTTLFNDGDNVGWSVPNGTELSGRYTFDSTTPDGSPSDPEHGRYYDTIVDLSLSLAEDETTRIGIFNHIFIRTDDINDQYILRDRNLVFKDYESNFSFLLADAQANVFASDALPEEPPPLGEFEATDFVLSGLESEYSIHGDITSLTLVPEPSTLVLLAGATLMAGCVRRRTSEVR
ncbi:MAG: PEP-CTERM sorting domain-containing protein [Phycisphaerales bacterium]|nr:PEP-CTERM sorting domain-containing protein [Phycisphaerales bacterium]